ncbi:conjugating enzyme E2 [Seminavis robusta]|uniref:E2 ubiquitin-conjugating enzyme n=1 Tax=Seminavis robusta TaxID=568900 RepID=A0A9N8DF68_9STRA|nr:conjugating enzyme E2 [Seminavis robusta]|eukprot:Sro65_g036850.1 conjugating enzyme E2 (194) ;mRNA; r:98812-99603
MASQGRIVKELAEVGKDDKVSGIKAVPVTEGDLRHLKGTIPGPQGTPYEGGIFEIDIVLPKQYPFEPPKMKYITKIWHPNISSQTGAICLDILKDQWSPALTIKTALLSLQALMCSAEPGDPQDAEVAKMYMGDRKKFDSTAKFWTETYAKPTSKEDAITRVCEMGFDRESARKALEKTGWDESAAVNSLLGM